MVENLTITYSVNLEKVKVKMKDGEMSIVYGVPQPIPSSISCAIIAPGSGGGMNHFLVRYFHEQLAQNGCLTVKFNYPRMVALGGLLKAPAPGKVLVETYQRLIQEVKKGKYQPAKVFAGGFSLGAVVASQAVANNPDHEVDGLFFLSYPLHQRNKPDKISDNDQLYSQNCRILFISGTQDPTANKEKLEAIVARIGSTATVHWIQAGNHVLKPGWKPSPYKQALAYTVSALSKWFAA